MFGQKKTFFEAFILIGPIFFAVISMPLIPFLMRFDVYGFLMLVSVLTGVALFLISKWGEIKKGQFFIFGPKEMNLKNRRRYYFGYVLMLVGLSLGFFDAYVVRS